jgi:hypothetical protein
LGFYRQISGRERQPFTGGNAEVKDSLLQEDFLGQRARIFPEETQSQIFPTGKRLSLSGGERHGKILEIPETFLAAKF